MDSTEDADDARAVSTSRPGAAIPQPRTAAGLPAAAPVAGVPAPRAPEPVHPIGSVLVDRGLITREQLAWALGVQQRTGSRLGAILVSSGLVRRLDLYRTLAAAWRHEFLDVAAADPDPSLLTGLTARRLTDEGWIPVRHEADGAVLVATSEEPSTSRRQGIEGVLGAPVRLVITTDWDILHAVRRLFADSLVDEAALGLWRRAPVQSARTVLAAQQKVAGIALVAALVACVVLWPRGTLVGVSAAVSVGYLAGILFKFAVSLAGARREAEEVITDAEVASLRDDELPVYTVLVPVYREANVVADLVENLSRLDYPAEKLEILLLLESEDDETRAAAAAADCPQTVTFVTIPPGGPQTKPKACNVGLFFARGEFLVIYDAEDRPDPDQLKKAVVAFRRAEAAGDDDLVCVQAALNYWNAGENLLTRMFTLEYSFWFDYMLPGLDAMRLPIPLGGTSNHFRTAQLRALGGWDPFNVTEDADLGIRAAALGLRVGVINSTTFEEANRAYGNWIRQRSRWIKGYLQTTLVHLRRPWRLTRQVGPRKAAAFALLVGGTPLSFLCAPPLYAIFVVSLLVPWPELSRLFPGPVLLIGAADLLIGNAAMVYVAMMGAFKRRRYRLVPWALLNPVYWLLHSIAAYKALWQLVTKPHYWEKTEHGLSAADPGENSAGATSPPREVVR
jgi:cellulose synthase/poly-beta-1,6-N-acetylglucosamine synthase-like glycosyltransferase